MIKRHNMTPTEYVYTCNKKLPFQITWIQFISTIYALSSKNFRILSNTKRN